MTFSSAGKGAGGGSDGDKGDDGCDEAMAFHSRQGTQVSARASQQRHAIGRGATCYKQLMRSIGVRELRQNASRYLREVKRGETVEVTERGEPVARLVPIPERESTYDRMVAEGRIIPIPVRATVTTWGRL